MNFKFIVLLPFFISSAALFGMEIEKAEQPKSEETTWSNIPTLKKIAMNFIIKNTNNMQLSAEKIAQLPEDCKNPIYAELQFNELMEATKKNHIAALWLALEKNYSLPLQKISSYTVIQEDVPSVFLVQKNISGHIQPFSHQWPYLQLYNAQGESPLHYAVKKCSIEVVKELLNIDYFQKNPYIYDSHAYHKNNLLNSPKFINKEKYPKFKKVYPEAYVELYTYYLKSLDSFWAWATNKKNKAYSLMEESAKITIPFIEDLKKNKKTTPLTVAVKNNKEDMIKLLLEYGADHTIISRKNLSLLDLSASQGNPNLYNLFLGKINPNKQAESLTKWSNKLIQPHNKTLLQRAVEEKNIPLATSLIKQGADLTQEDEQGNSPLAIAEKNGILSTLLKSNDYDDVD